MILILYFAAANNWKGAELFLELPRKGFDQHML